MTVSMILLLLMGSLELVAASPHSVLERYEERLNTALLKRTGTPRTVKRYKCVEEYVTYDQHGRAVTSYQGTRFTTTMEPPVYRTSGEREIRRKPAKKVTIAINKDQMDTTTPIPVTSTKPSSTTSQKPFDEMNDEEADRIIEEMYLKKKESHASESPAEVVPQTASEVTQKPPHRSYATDSTSSSSSSNSGVQRYNPVKQNKIETDESDEDYPNSMYHRGSRKRPYEVSTYDDYDDDLPIYRPLRREYRMRRRRPILFSDDFSDDVDFEQRLSNTPHRQTTRDLSPLRSMKRLRHQVPFNPPYRQMPPSSIPLPVSASTNMIHRQMPLPIPNLGAAAPPAPHPLHPLPLQPMPPGMGVLAPSLPPPPQPLQPIQQQSSTNVRPGGEEVLKMKPILQANAQEMQDANEASCSKITTIAKNFGIKDVSKWARSNCSFLQMYAPTASCELIFHFIDSCKKKKFL